MCVFYFVLSPVRALLRGAFCVHVVTRFVRLEPSRRLPAGNVHGNVNVVPAGK